MINLTELLNQGREMCCYLMQSMRKEIRSLQGEEDGQKF